MKIITAAKQNMAQDPELLSEVCQQTLFKETVQQRGQGWRHSSAFLSFFYLNVPLNLFKFQRCDLPSCVQRGSKGSRGFPAVPITRDDVSASSARLPCVISAGFLSSGGKGEGDKSRKTGRLKSTITLFFFFFSISFTTFSRCVKLILTRPMKTTLWRNINTQGSLCFRHPCRFCFTRSSRVKHRPKARHRRYSWEVWELINSWKKFQ